MGASESALSLSLRRDDEITTVSELLETIDPILETMRSLKIVQLGELKGRLTEVISNCDTLCKSIEEDGPESLKSPVNPFVVTTTDLATVGKEPNLVRRPR